MLKKVAMVLALAWPQAGVASAERLRDEASAYAGRPVRLDERLAVPTCPSGFAFRVTRPDSVEASCPEAGWRMQLPLTVGPQAALPRRGQALRVEVEGPGYRAAVDGIVESANAREGTVVLRNPRSGARFVGRIQADGRIFANSIATP